MFDNFRMLQGYIGTPHAFKAVAFKGLSDFMSTFTGQATMAIGTTHAMTKAIQALSDAYNLSYDSAMKNTSENLDSFNSTKSEIENLKSQAEEYKATLSSFGEKYDVDLSGIDSIEEKISALQSSAKIELIDQIEIDKISEANSKLESQLSIKERLSQSQQKEAAYDAKDTLNRGKQSVAQQVAQKVPGGKMTYQGMVNNVNIATAVKEDIAAIKEYETKVSDLEKSMSGMEPKSKEWKQAEKDIASYNKAIDELTVDLDSKEVDLDKLVAATSVNGEGLEALKGFEDEFNELKSAYEAVNNIDLSPAEQELNNLESFFSSTSGNAIGDYLNNIVAESGNAEDALNKFKELGLSLDDIGVSQDNFLKYFQDVVTSAKEAEEAMSTLGTTLSDVDAAFESENQDASWSKFADYATQARELAKQGKWGTDDLQKSIEWILPKFDVENQLKKNGGDFEYVADVYEKKYKDAEKLYKKYFDAENPKDSAANFQNALIDKKLLKEDETGLTGTFDNTAQAAEKMKLSIEATEALLRNLESYGFEWDDVMFSGEGISDYETALNNIKAIRDSMSEGSAKERLDGLIDGEGGWEDQYKDFQNDLSKLTEDKIVHIEFEYSLAQLDAEIAELEKNVANSDGKDIKENAGLLAKKQTRRDTSEKYLTENRGMVIPVEYEFADEAISELQNKLKQSGLNEDQKIELQAEISNLTDLQNNLLDTFDSSNMSWNDFVKTDDYSKFVSDIDEAKSKIEKLNGESIKTNFDADTSKAESKIDGVLSNDGKTIVMNVEASTEQIQTQLDQLENGQTMRFKANVDGQQTGVSATKNEKGEITYTAVIDGVEKILNQNGTVNYTIGSQESPEDKNSNVNYTKGSQESPESKNTTVNYTKGNQQKPNKQKATVDYNKGKQQKPDNKSAGVNYNKTGQEAPSDKTAGVWYKVKGVIGGIKNFLTGGAGLNGTAHKEGTVKDDSIPLSNKSISEKTGGLYPVPKLSGRALAYGTLEDDTWLNPNWKTKKDEDALTGELGQEMVVSGNRWWTVGDNGAEFAHIPAGSVVFNAKQTKELLEKGFTPSRGTARLSGTAHMEGTAYASGNGGRKLTGSSSSTKKKTSSSKSSSKKSSSKKKSSKKSSKDSKKFKESFDWIEVAIDRIERAIETLDLKANSVYRSWSSRNKNLKSEISKVNKEITVQIKGAKRYEDQAKKVGLASKWKKKVQNGTIDISTIKDEKLAEKIKEYQKWYEKALDCKDAVVELQEKEKELYETAFNNVVSQYESILSIVEHKKNMLDESISQSEEKGYITSVKYYEALMKNEQDNVSKLQKEKVDLIKALNDAEKHGIPKNSESWYEMVNQIDEVTLAIEESNTAILQFGNSIRDIQWEIFDLLQKKISNITDESKFLIDLLSNDELYTDKGQLTNEGLTTMGLHGVNYNVDMAQADKYNKEIKELDKEIAKDPYDQNLIDRRQELLELQQDMILAAEDEKQAIRDMVEEGIERELDSLKDLIDTYTDALDAQKDLYDYQKRVKEQTKEIANLEKSLDAYKGDTSEEAKAKIQEMKVSLEEAKADLEETQYDRYVSDQKQMLDTLYDEYEEILNKRLDDIEALITDMIAKINENALSINSTLSEKAESVGYDLSDSMERIWNANNNKDVLTTYGEHIKTGIETATTTVNATLNAININLQNMITQLNAIANTKVQSATTSSAANSANTKVSVATPAPAKANTSKAPTTTKAPTSNSNKSGGDGKAKVGDKVTFNSGKYYANSSGGGASGSKNRGKSVYITRIKSGAKKPYHISTGKKLGSGDLGWLTLSQLKGYASGTKSVSSDQLAWTQEGKKPEVIIRKKDGAVLTPVNQKDMILNSAATEALYKMANTPHDYIMENLGLDRIANAAQNISRVDNSNRNVNNEINMSFTLPNVKNTDDFINELQHSKRFEGIVQAMTVGQMSGGSSLRKYRF